MAPGDIYPTPIVGPIHALSGGLGGQVGNKKARLLASKELGVGAALTEAIILLLAYMSVIVHWSTGSNVQDTLDYPLLYEKHWR